MASTLQQAWENAQPKLGVIRNALSTQISPQQRILRVGQLDSELLDQELVHLLKEPLNKAIALINSSLRARFEPELMLLIQLSLYKFSIWDVGASYGAMLQNLRYAVKNSAGRVLSPSGLPRRTLLIHGTLTILVPYAHTRFRAYALTHAWPDAPTSDRRRKAWSILTSLESSHTLLALLSFVTFLWDGQYRTVADRLLKMRLTSSHRLAKRDVSYEFMNRQMVWHAFTEFLLFLLPLIPARSIRGRLIRLVSPKILVSLSSFFPARLHTIFGLVSDESHKSTQGKLQKRGKYWSLPLDQCAICAENASFSLGMAGNEHPLTTDSFIRPSTPIAPQQSSSDTELEPPAHPLYTPYRASCGDIYCYHCIVECMMRAADDGEDGWECLRCRELVRSVDRFRVAGISEIMSDMSESEHDLSASDIDFADMGSYSESGLSE